MYADKLKEFNETEKYKRELEFLRGFLKGKILDYGCGTGYAAHEFRADGYDKHHHNPDFKYLEEVRGVYNTIYLMHSFAHMENPAETLRSLRRHLTPHGRIIIITPNKDWLDMLSDANYTPDPTVIMHYSQYALQNLVKSLNFDIIHQGQFGERIGDFNERLIFVIK